MARNNTMNNVQYIWKNQARIYTYPNPKELNESGFISEIMKKYPHFCASNTLMQGLEEKYGRENFSVISSVDKLVHFLFNGQLDNAATDLQIYLDISRMIDNIKIPGKSVSKDFLRAFEQNKTEIVNAFKLLIISDFEINDFSKLPEEQRLFFEFIYNPLRKEYKKQLKTINRRINKKSVSKCMENVLADEINYHFKPQNKIRNLDEGKILLKKIIKDSSADKYDKEKARKIITIVENFKNYNFGTIVIHGVLRFSPEIMKTIETLDSIGIKIIFLINYAANIPVIYDVWKKAYDWTGCEFENVSNINLSKGVEAGKRIAEVCSGNRVKGRCNAIIKEYKYLTDFTDGEVRKTYDKALKLSNGVNSAALRKMEIQYYAVNPDKANEVLKNYFPEQFTDKPFMSYPVGRFIAGIYQMWNFDTREMEIDFDELMECSVAHIGHNTEKMGEIIRNIRLFCSDKCSVSDIKRRAQTLVDGIETIGNDINQQYRRYLSYYSLSVNEVNNFVNFIEELQKISERLFSVPADKIVDYREHFHKTMEIVNDATVDKLKVTEKENELIQLLMESLSMDGEREILGTAKELKKALQFFMSTKRERKSSDWIIRGFDQLDGAPFLCERTQRIYEFSLVSMKNMTKDGRDMIPWPLSEDILTSSLTSNVYMAQLENVVETRSNYLLYYLFYASFFSCAGIRFSYVVNENNEKQRLYYLLRLINACEPRTGTLNKIPKKYKDVPTQPSSSICIDINERERRIFSICRYKYFLSGIMKEDIKYTSPYQALYFIKIDAALLASELCEYDESKLEDKMDQIMDVTKQWHPYLDDANLSDIRRFVRGHFYTQKPDDVYISKKRDFLIAQWEEETDNGEHVKMMDYNATKKEAREYIVSSNIYPSLDKWPHPKVCQECNYNEICMKYYFDKVVDS